MHRHTGPYFTADFSEMNTSRDRYDPCASPSVRTVVVTGAAGGLGSRLVKHFVSTGSQVFAVDIHCPDKVAENVTVICADLSSPPQSEAAIQTIATECDAIDYLINCAGVFREDDFGPKSWDVLNSLWSGNVLSVVMPTLGLQKLLAAGREPLVLNIASTDAIVASGGQNCEIGVSHDIFYSLTKGAVVTFTRALAMKWAPLGIRVNALCPTIFASPMTASLLDIPGKIDDLRGHLPLGRLCTLDDIVAAVDAMYKLRMTTGHVLPVDGGYLCQ